MTITKAEVLELAAAGSKNSEIARVAGVSRERIRQIVNCETTRSVRETLPFRLPKCEMSDATAAYLAGIIDGEGTITLIGNPKSRGEVVEIYNCDAGLMEWIQREVPVTGRLYLKPRANPLHRRVYRYDWWGRGAVQVLLAVQKYLVIKAEQAAIVLGMSEATEWERFIDGTGGRRLSANALERRSAATIKIRALNRRGVQGA